MAAVRISAGPGQREWITPEEQLLHLALPLAKECVRTSRMRPSLRVGRDSYGMRQNGPRRL